MHVIRHDDRAVHLEFYAMVMKTVVSTPEMSEDTPIANARVARLPRSSGPVVRMIISLLSGTRPPLVSRRAARQR